MTTSLSANWTDFSDLVTGDTLSFLDDRHDPGWRRHPHADPISENGYDASYHPLYATGLDLAMSTKYYVTVTATDAALSESVMRPLRLTTISELTAGVVYDGTAKDGTEEPTQTSTASLSANWTGFSDLVTGDTLTYSWNRHDPGWRRHPHADPISENGYDASYHPLYATGLDLAVGTKYS